MVESGRMYQTKTTTEEYNNLKNIKWIYFPKNIYYFIYQYLKKGNAACVCVYVLVCVWHSMLY